MTRAQWGDLTGLNLAGMVRMSDESVRASDLARAAPAHILTGHDIKGREVQELDCRAVAEKRGGRYVFTYEEPDTSAWSVAGYGSRTERSCGA